LVGLDTLEVVNELGLENLVIVLVEVILNLALRPGLARELLPLPLVLEPLLEGPHVHLHVHLAEAELAVFE